MAVLLTASWRAPDARAQTDNRFAVGLGVTSRVAPSAESGSSADVGFEIRLGHETGGWGPQVSLFNWFDTDVDQQIRLQRVNLGILRVRPVMAGYGYTWIRGRTAITGDLVGGFAFNSFHLDPDATAEYQRLGATGIQTEVTNTFALKPEAQIWYDLNNRFGLKLNGGYLIARPSVTIKSSLGTDTYPIRANSFLITFGVVYSIM